MKEIKKVPVFFETQCIMVRRKLEAFGRPLR